MNLNQEVSARLRFARKRAGLRLADVDRLAPGHGLGRSNLCKLEQGAAEWTIGKIEVLCDLYRIKVVEVFG